MRHIGNCVKVERRYGVRYDQPLIRLRLLDPALGERFGGLTDISLPLDRFATLDPPCRRVFITENKINGLSFPPLPDSLVIFGLGYGVESLRDAPWLRQREIHYWGDLDTHGFAILSLLRGWSCSGICGTTAWGSGFRSIGCRRRWGN